MAIHPAEPSAKSARFAIFARQYRSSPALSTTQGKSRTPKFVLVDHSILGIGGHHYEYAAHVLAAAARLGFQPVLAAGAKFQNTGELPWQVLSAYRYGFWPRMATSLLAKTSTAIATGPIPWLSRFKTRLFFSRLGFLWAIRNEPLQYVRWHPFDSAVPDWMLFGAAALLWPLKTMVGLLLRIIPFQAYFKELFHHLAGIVKTLMQTAVEFVTSQGPLEQWRFARRKGRSFGADTGRVVRQLNLTADDIVFIPTLAEPELIGLVNEFLRNPRVSKPAFHLLFRRNIYNGREPDYASQEGDVLPLRNAFLRARAVAGENLHFYTDTEELCRQYNRLNVFHFAHCPIPHTYPPVEVRPEGPLRLTYLGDARREKGYPLLPGLVADVHRDYVATGKVRFIVQSNYNIAAGEPDAIVARSLLQSYPGSEVEVLTQPLSSEEYRRRLLDADILLLPYSRDEYYARSSGVVIEALAAGIPVVVSAGSWLARQIAQPVSQYRRQLGAPLERTAASRRETIWFRENDGTTQSLRSPDTLSFGSENSKVYSWWTIPVDADILRVRFRFGSQAGQGVLCYSDQVDATGKSLGFGVELLVPGHEDRESVFLVPIRPQAHRVWIAMRNAFNDDLITVSLISVDFRSSGGNGSFPRSAVGTTFCFPNQFRNAVEEVVQHYEHYRKTARDYASKINSFHNAEEVVRLLTGTMQPASQLVRSARA